MLPHSPEEKLLPTWQRCIDLLAKIVNVPAGLIMRIRDNDIEVFVSSHTGNNPYHPGDKERFWDSGLYCETVVRSKKRLVVPDALSDPEWANNPDVKLNMISYMGYPIYRPNGEPFGTICVLDNKPNSYTDDYVNLIEQFRDLIEITLAIEAANQEILDQQSALRKNAEDISQLRDLIPICAYCKNVRDDQGYWQKVEEFIYKVTETDTSHGICPTCLKKYFPEVAKELGDEQN